MTSKARGGGGGDAAALSASVPSDWDHARTLVALSFRKDRRRPKLWALRWVIRSSLPRVLHNLAIAFFFAYIHMNMQLRLRGASPEEGGATFSVCRSVLFGLRTNKKYDHGSITEKLAPCPGRSHLGCASETLC